jgi:hypothetical protein
MCGHSWTTLPQLTAGEIHGACVPYLVLPAPSFSLSRETTRTLLGGAGHHQLMPAGLDKTGDAVTLIELLKKS